MRRHPYSHRWPAWLDTLRVVGRRPRLIDAFLLFNEIDLLEIRLCELDRVVDKFVIVESDRTFAGRPKPYFFEQWRHRFRRWERKIAYHKLHLPELSYTGDESERFHNERRNRDELGHAVAGLGLSSDDIVVISDVDEIWRASYARRIRRALQDHDFCVAVLRNHRGYINNLSTRALNGVPCAGPVACRQGILSIMGAEEIRPWRLAQSNLERISFVNEAGWHFSSLGGPEAFWIKAQNFSHVVDPERVIDIPEGEQEIRVLTGPIARDACVVSQHTYLDHAPSDPAFSPLTYDEFVIEEDLPSALRAHKERYRHFFFFTDCA